MLILAVLIFGGLALKDLSVDLLPDIDAPSLLVRTDWPGAAPREVELRINRPVEGLLSTLPGLKSMQGFARQGQSLISLQFEWGHNMDLALLNVREKLDQASYLLPEDAERSRMVYTSAQDKPIAVLGVTLKDVAEPELSDRLQLKRWTAEVLSRKLEQADEIAQAIMVGALEPEVEIRYDADQLSRFDLQPANIEQLIRQSNQFTTAGELRDGWYRYSLKLKSRIESLSDIKNIVVTSLGSGKAVLLKDVADVRLAEADPTSFALVDGRRLLMVYVKKEYGTNTVSAYRSMLPLIDELRTQNPDIAVEVLREEASFISQAIDNLLQTLLIGGVLAFLVLFLFLDDIRIPFTIGVAIPVSIFLTFFAMNGLGINLNIISLSGLSLGIGLLLDNAIIVLENINRHFAKGMSLKAAAGKGTREIALAVTASTFTTISVFLPLVLLGGFEGELFSDQAYTLSISLLASLGVALLILPVLVVQVSRKGKRDRTVAGFSRFFDSLLDRYEASIDTALTYKKSFLSVTTLLLLASGYLFLYVGKQSLPVNEPKRLNVMVELPANATLTSTRLSAQTLSGNLKSRFNRMEDIQVVGGFTDQTNLNALSEEGLNKFRISIPVNGFADQDRKLGFVEEQLANFPDWNYRTEPESQNYAILPGLTQPPVLFRVAGNDREQSKKAGKELEAFLADTGLETPLKRQFDREIGTYSVRFLPDRMMQLDISEEQVTNALRSIAQGVSAGDWNLRDENVRIRLKQQRTVKDPSTVVLKIGNRFIPLTEVADIEQSSELEQLERINQTPVLSFISGLEMADWWWERDAIETAISDFTRLTGIEILIGGSAPQLIELLREMGLLLAISIVVIYIILAIQFENLKYPLIIILAIPFAWIGSILALWFTGVTLNALSFMGILILTGIAVNDSILKVDFMRRYYLETGNLREAVREAGKNRFRPVIMTSITTVLGLVPMLIPFGEAYEFRLSLAIALMGGMITSTLLTLYIIPIIYHSVESRAAKTPL